MKPSVPFANPLTRLEAQVVDLCFLAITSMIGGAFGRFVASMILDIDASQLSRGHASFLGSLYGSLSWGAACWIFNYCMLPSLVGASLGKLIFKLQIVNEDGSPTSFWRCGLRSLCYLVSASPFGIGFLAMIWSKENQCWHDLVSGTVVIKKGVKYPETATDYSTEKLKESDMSPETNVAA